MSAAENIKIGGLILAAGQSRRMGVAKQSLVISGKTLLEHAIDTMLAVTLERLIVVLKPGLTSPDRDDDRLSYLPARCESQSQVQSLQQGLEALSDLDALLVTLVDLPGIGVELVAKIIAAFKQRRPLVCYPVHNGRQGHPVLFDASLFSSLAGLPPTGRALEVLEKNRDRAFELHVDDGSFLVDMDTPEDVERWREFTGRR